MSDLKYARNRLKNAYENEYNESFEDKIDALVFGLLEVTEYLIEKEGLDDDE